MIEDATNDNDDVFKTGAQLLAEWGALTPVQKLERACAALMEQLNELHCAQHGQNLFEQLESSELACSCADAYRMGFEALKGGPLEGEIRRRGGL